MRPRRILVRLHRWLAVILAAWVFVVAVTGGWLVVHDAVESWLDRDRYEATPGDVGPEVAADAARAALGDDVEFLTVTMPRNGRGVYQVYGEVPIGDPAAVPEGTEPAHRQLRVFVDPGTGAVNDVKDEEAGLSWWLYRGHMYLWQDFGPFGIFDPDTGACRPDAGGVEPGGVGGVICDVVPDSMDLVGWLGVGLLVVLLSGFYLWYWPGVRRWATALVIRRGRGPFTTAMSVHKVIGIVTWVPLTIVAVTGIAFAFPNLSAWYENATPAQRDFALWTPPDDASTSSSAAAGGAAAIEFDRVLEIIETRYPERAVISLSAPADETGTYSAWLTRGFDPWTREAGGGNTYVAIDQYRGEILYDGPPSEGNVFDQAWDDWSFPLHTGDFGGTTTRVLWVGLALSPVALAVSGITMNRIRARKRARRRDGAGTGVAMGVR